MLKGGVVLKSDERRVTRQERRKNQKKLQRFNLIDKGVITLNYAYKIGRLLVLILRFFGIW